MSDPLDIAAELAKPFEGFEPTAYHGENDRPDVWTIGYGHTGPDVVPGKTISQYDAEVLLRADLAEAAGHVMRLVTADITDNQRAALIDFTFNEGCGNLASSTLLKLLNSGAPMLAVAAEFDRWDKSNGHEVAGLLRRREAEKALFLS
jgi:lysozyme